MRSPSLGSPQCSTATTPWVQLCDYQQLLFIPRHFQHFHCVPGIIPHISCSNITFRVWPTFWVYGNFSTDFIFTTISSAFLQTWVFSFSTTFPRASTLLLLPDEFSQVFQNLFSPLYSSYTAILPYFPGLPSYRAVTLQDSTSGHALPRSRSATYPKGSSKHPDLHPPALPEISLFQQFYPQLRYRVTAHDPRIAYYEFPR